MNRAQFTQSFQHQRNISDVPDYPLPYTGRPAAVLIPLIEREVLSVLFTRRADHLKHHAGQISFPGGKQENSDLCLQDTALRETEEEIGLQRAHIEIIGQLNKYRTITGFEVTPFIGFVNPAAVFDADKSEVEETFEVPLSHFLDPKSYFEHRVFHRNEARDIYFIVWQGKQIWGATAAFIRSLANHLQPAL